jgi:cellulose synthase/poly-beta-1,6-N-acetylglucosamine synthase-like glycosyltransferase
MARTGLTGGVRIHQALVVAFAVAVLSATTVQIATVTHDWLLIAYWTLGASAIGGCLLAFIVGRRYTHLPVADGRVLCIVPAYNEPPESLARTLDALLAQTVEIDIVVIDDGSAMPVVPSRDHPRVRWLRQDNTGKRGAQVAVLRGIPRGTYEFVLTVDSDSQPFPDACEHLLRSMWDPRVQAATGMIYVRNHAESWVARASDIDIGGSCVMMRASRSMLGALETTSGALALYRSSLLYDHLDAYAVECGTGDDRWLALRALRRGEVVAVAEACVETDMPATVRGTYRQRLRWARSWWWMLPYVFRHLRPRQFLSPLYGMTQLVVTPFLLIYAVIVGTSIWVGDGAASSATVWLYAIDYLVIRYVLAALYLLGRPNMSTRDKWVSFFVGTPGAIVLNILLLSPTRYWALARLFDNRWQTRQAPGAAVDPA